jgi:hypothetical protein
MPCRSIIPSLYKETVVRRAVRLLADIARQRLGGKVQRITEANPCVRSPSRFTALV